jgi:hypothetical protein
LPDIVVSTSDGIESRVNQRDNTAQGDIVGRDKIQNVTIGAPTRSSHIALLLSKLREEQSQKRETATTIPELRQFEQSREEPLVPLETKLREGHREDLLDFALEMKERFVKQLARNTLFESAQKIHYHFLERICSVFQTRIMPAIREKQPRLAIERLIQTEITDPILADLDDNPFLYSDRDVQGMLYYLTGNCYIRWN